MTELIAIFQVLDKQVASNNASVVFPAKETNSPAPHQATLSHRLLQHPNTNSNGNGKHGSDDSGSMKSEKKRKFTSQEDSFIWDTYAAFTTNRNLEEDASFSVPDGVVAELAQKLNTNTQKLQARLRELKTERKFQRMMREAQEKAKAQAQQQSKSSKSERRDRDHTNSVNPPMLNTVESAVVSPAPAVDASSNRHSRPQVPHSAPIKPRKTGPYTAEEDATLWADYENNFYQFPDRDQLPRLSTVLQRSTDSLQQRLTQLIADQSGVPVDEVETVEFSPSDDAHIWNTYSKRATAAATITAGLRGGAQNSEDARDALEIQVAEELAPLLGKFYGRIWYRLQWLKEHPIPKKAAPAIPAPFPSPAVRTSSSTPSSSNGGHIFGESTGGVGTTSPQEMMKDSTALAGSKRRRDFESPHSPPSQKTQHSHSARHRLRSATTSTTPPLGSKATVGQKQQLQQDEDDVESGEVSSSGEEVGGGGEGADDDVDKEPDSEEEDADGDSASTYSTRTEGSDSKAKGKNKGNGRGGAGRGTSKPAPSTSTVKSSGRNTNNSRAAGLLPSDGDSDSVGDEDGGDDDDSDRQERQQDRRARKESRDRLLRTGRYCEEEDLEIWLAYTANEGESPVKLGKALSKVARKILRTYNSVAGRLERLLAQQDEAKDQYAPGGSVDDDADADSGDAGGDGAGDGDAEADADGGGDEGTPAAGVAKEEDARSGTATEGEGGDDVGTRRR